MTFSEKTLQAKQSHTASGKSSSAVSKPLFRRCKLAALIASTMFLHACTNLPDNATDYGVTTGGDRAGVGTYSQSTAYRSPRVSTSPLLQSESTPDADGIADQPQLVWHRISQGMQFANTHRNDEIQAQINWFINNPNYILQVTERSAPFIYEIVMEIERRGLPLELALLPMIESSYNPKARSSANAAGLWQFMARTAANFGLQRDFWYDGRQDPIASTNAALDYLERLHTQFDGDWLLALAAYNAGEGTVLRAIDRNKRRDRATDFWSLPLPGETHNHIPRLLGLAYVISEPEKYGIALSEVPFQPYLAQVDPGTQMDLNLIANLAGVDPETVFRLNPGYLQWGTHPDGPHTVMLPAEVLETFEYNFANMANTPTTWDRYVIRSGDTLSAIARNHGTQVTTLQQLNNLTGSRIVAGQTLLIPRAYREGDALSAPTSLLAAANSFPVPSGEYQVQRGDSLWRIANRYKLDIDELAALNNLSTEGVLRVGQKLKLQSDVTLAANDTAGLSTAGQLQDIVTQYRVRRGDTLARIAREHNVTVRDLTEWNQINSTSIIRPGQELLIRKN
jgi:membrane-bound lytic murein transglycosylase D